MLHPSTRRIVMKEQHMLRVSLSLLTGEENLIMERQPDLKLMRLKLMILSQRTTQY